MFEKKRFQKKIEKFVCVNCGASIKGTGYTDHCPKCLWSLHIDILPGDRSSQCKGLMEPVYIDKQGDKYRICYVCTKCGYKHTVKASVDDNFDEIVKISQKSLGK